MQQHYHLAQHSHAPVYTYWFNHAYDNSSAWGPNYTYCDGCANCRLKSHYVLILMSCFADACHGIELAFIFGTPEGQLLMSWGNALL